MARSGSRRSPGAQRAAGLTAGLALLLTGCLTMPPRSRTPAAGAVVLDEVPVREFGVDRCGAGSLSSVLAYFGDPIPMEELDARLPKSDDNGVITLDMILAARDRGFDARLVAGDAELLESTLLERRPAILMLRVLNAPGLGKDYFHYVVADGVDPERGLFRLQFGDGKRRWAPLDGLERAWSGTDHTMILVEPRVGGEVSTEVRTAGAGLGYGVALEEAGRTGEAATLYRGLLERGPESPRVWTNLGNAEAAQGNAERAEEAYRRALELDPAHRDALNNLAWLLLEEGARLDEAAELARRAVETGGPDPHLALDTLARVHAARGRCQEAADAFAHALAGAPPDPATRGQIADAARAAEESCSETPPGPT